MKIDLPGCGNLSIVEYLKYEAELPNAVRDLLLERVAKCERLEKRVGVLEERDDHFVQSVREISSAVLDKRLSVRLLRKAINVILEDVQSEKQE